jgi:hypothetical protein
MMITAHEYRQMADDCFGWAREAQTDEVRLCYVNLAQTWLEAAGWIEDASLYCTQRKFSLVGQPPVKRKAA